MKKKWIWIVVLGPIAIALFITVGGEVVLHLWNWLVPALFGWRQITFWQAVGLLALCRILFGGLGGGGHRSKDRRGTEDHWECMPPEARERFRQRMAERFGFVPPAGEKKEQ